MDFKHVGATIFIVPAVVLIAVTASQLLDSEKCMPQESSCADGWQPTLLMLFLGVLFLNIGVAIAAPGIKHAASVGILLILSGLGYLAVVVDHNFGLSNARTPVSYILAVVMLLLGASLVFTGINGVRLGMKHKRRINKKR